MPPLTANCFLELLEEIRDCLKDQPGVTVEPSAAWQTMFEAAINNALTSQLQTILEASNLSVTATQSGNWSVDISGFDSSALDSLVMAVEAGGPYSVTVAGGQMVVTIDTSNGPIPVTATIDTSNGPVEITGNVAVTGTVSVDNFPTTVSIDNFQTLIDGLSGLTVDIAGQTIELGQTSIDALNADDDTDDDRRPISPQAYCFVTGTPPNQTRVERFGYWTTAEQGDDPQFVEVTGSGGEVVESLTDKLLKQLAYCVALDVTKESDLMAPVSQGDLITYTISATASGGDITINDPPTLPAGVTLVNPPALPLLIAEGMTQQWTAQYTVSAANVIANEVVCNTTVTGVGPNGQEITGTGSDTLTPVDAASSDLEVSKTVSNATPNVGGQTQFTVSVQNNGPDDASNVSVTDQLPTGLTFVSALPSTGVYDNVTGIWSVGTLANGGSATLTITASVDAGTDGQTLTNTAAATSDSDDPNTTNSSDSVDVQPQALTEDLSLSKSVDNPTPQEGDTITYTLVASNNDDGATNVVVVDQLPAGLTYVSSSPAGYDPVSGNWPLGNFGPANSVALQIVATVDAGTVGQTLTNSATISADEVDPNPANNVGQVDIDVQPLNVSLSKSGVPVPQISQQNLTILELGYNADLDTVMPGIQNDLFAQPNYVLSNTSAWPDPFQNPAPGPRGSQLFNPQLPAGTTSFTLSITESGGQAAGAFGISAFDITTGQVFAPQVGGNGSGTLSVPDGQTRVGTWLVPHFVDPANVRLFTTGFGATNGNQDEITFNSAVANVRDNTQQVDFTFEVTNNGATSVAGLTVDSAQLGVSALALTPDPIPAGGSATATVSYTPLPSDIVAGQIQCQGVLTQDNSISDIAEVSIANGTLPNECNQLDWRRRLPAAGAPQDFASVLGGTALNVGAFSAPGQLNDLGTTDDGPFDTYVDLDLPADASSISFTFNNGGSAGALEALFIDKTTGLPVQMASVTGHPATANNEGFTAAQGQNATVVATLPAGIDPTNLALVVFDIGAAGGTFTLLTLTNFVCA